MQTVRQSSPIRSEGPLNLLLAACQRAEKEVEAKRGDNISFQESFDIEDDYILLPHAILMDENFSETNSSSSKKRMTGRMMMKVERNLVRLLGWIQAILLMPKKSSSIFSQEKYLYQNKDRTFVRD